MPFRTDGDDWGAADESDDAWEEIDGDEDDSEPMIPCPYCGREIHEDAVRCCYCEHYISAEDAPAGRKPWWIVVGAALCLYAVYRWTAG